MFTEIIKLKPVMDSAQLNRMFGDLTRRFGSVAKRFGEGMKNAFKFGGVISLVGAVVSKLVNPLERAEELFHKITNKGDDLVTNAEEFGTTPGKLARLEALAAAKGVDAETLRTLLGKFQGALAKEQDAAAAPARLRRQIAAESDPVQKRILEAQLVAANATAAQGGTLHQFLGEKDIGEAFFKFIQSLQKLDKSRQTVVQSEVFGERIRGKAAEFFNATDFAEILAKLPSADALGAAAEKTGRISDLNDLLKAVRESQDFVTKSSLVSEQQAVDIDQAERNKDKADNETLRRFDALKTSSIAIQELTNKFDKFATELTTQVLPDVVKGLKEISKMLPSVSEAKSQVSSVADPILQGIANFQYNAEGAMADPGQALRNDIQNLKSWLESIWAEFKGSRIWRTFGN